MPVEYRLALKRNPRTAARNEPLDAVRSLSDDSMRSAVDEVPVGYMEEAEREKTIAFLEGRRDRLHQSSVRTCS